MLYQSDNLFWEIFDMEDNKKQRDSLRENGAYTVPSLKIGEYSLDIIESADLEEVSRRMVKFTFEEHNGFVSRYKDSKTFNRFSLHPVDYQKQ